MNKDEVLNTALKLLGAIMEEVKEQKEISKELNQSVSKFLTKMRSKPLEEEFCEEQIYLSHDQKLFIFEMAHNLDITINEAINTMLRNQIDKLEKDA